MSTPLSRREDVAALFFYAPVARHGYGGYLTSDAPTNEWLCSWRKKMLVGYPMDAVTASMVGATILPGEMHATKEDNYLFTQESDRVYTTTGFLSFPGNSGGPCTCCMTTTHTIQRAFIWGAWGTLRLCERLTATWLA